MNKDQSLYVHTNQSKAAVIPLPHIDSFPAPTVSWYENGQELNEFGQRYHVTLNKSLVLLDRDIQDSNFQYQPRALNGNTGVTFDGPFILVTVSSKYMQSWSGNKFHHTYLLFYICSQTFIMRQPKESLKCGPLIQMYS